MGSSLKQKGIYMRCRLCGLLLALCLFLPLGLQASTALPPDASFDVGFSPNGESLNLVLSAIGSARESILVAAYTFTSKPIATALVAAKKRGVQVFVVADKKSNSGQYTAVTFLANMGVSVRLDDHYAIFHNKFMVIDLNTLETGSFNYSASAVSRNAENVFVLWNAPSVAALYGTTWRKLWDESEPLEARY